MSDQPSLPLDEVIDNKGDLDFVHMIAAKRLIEDETVLLVNKILAKAFGLNNAIVFRQILYWIDIKRKAKSKEHFRDQCWWTYNSYTDWKQENFDFWSRDTIIRIITRLEELGLVRSGNYNQREKDLTKWYTVNYSAYYAFMKLWTDHAYPVAGDGKSSLAYKEFLEDWDAQKNSYDLLSKCADPICNLHRGYMQVATDVTIDYTKKKKKDSVATKKVATDGEEKKAKTKRVPNPMYDAVLKVWGYTAALNGEMQKMLEGVSKRKGFKEYNLETPITPEALLEWSGWYRETVLHGEDDLNMLEDRLKVQSSITKWQDERFINALADQEEAERQALAERRARAMQEEQMLARGISVPEGSRS